MIPEEAIKAKSRDYLNNKVTLRRLNTPLLYAYDACTFLRRLRGLHGVPPLEPTGALILRPCHAVHTFGLKATIDVAFLNRNGVVLKCISLPPRRMAMCWSACVVIEMAHGTANRIGLGVGQQFLPDTGNWK